MESFQLNMLENSGKILLILKETGALTFTNLVNQSGLSRNTVSKYLKQLIEENNIKRDVTTSNQGRNKINYVITEQGIQLLNSSYFGDRKSNWLSKILVKNETLDKLIEKNLITITTYNKEKTNIAQIEDRFFNLINAVLNILEYSGEDLEIVNQKVVKIGSFASKFGEKFFEKEPNLLLYLAIIYIFFNSLENLQYKIDRNSFIMQFGHSDENFRHATSDFGSIKESIQEKVNDIQTLDELELILKVQEQNRATGAFKQEPYAEPLNDILLKIEQDLKKKTRSKFKENEMLISNFRYKFVNYLRLISKFNEDFLNSLNLIIEGNFGINHFTHNYESYFFHESDTVGAYLNQRINDALTEELINKRIFGLKQTYPLVSLAEDITNEMETKKYLNKDIRDSFYDVVLNKIFNRSAELELRRFSSEEKPLKIEEIKGFCNVCGHNIFKDADECEFCKSAIIDENNLIFNIKEAQKISASYKAELYVEHPFNSGIFTQCECGNMVARSWTICPLCKTKR